MNLRLCLLVLLVGGVVTDVVTVAWQEAVEKMIKLVCGTLENETVIKGFEPATIEQPWRS